VSCGFLLCTPVRQVLGGFRTSIPAYASTVAFGSVEGYLDIATQCLKLLFAEYTTRFKE